MKLRYLITGVVILATVFTLCSCSKKAETAKEKTEVTIDNVITILEDQGYIKGNTGVNQMGREDGVKTYVLTDNVEDLNWFLKFNYFLGNKLNADDMSSLLVANISDGEKQNRNSYNLYVIEFNDDDIAASEYDYVKRYWSDVVKRYDQIELTADGINKDYDADNEYVAVAQFTASNDLHTEVYGLLCDNNIIVFYTVSCVGDDYEKYVDNADEICEELGIKKPGSLFE